MILWAEFRQQWEQSSMEAARFRRRHLDRPEMVSGDGTRRRRGGERTEELSLVGSSVHRSLDDQSGCSGHEFRRYLVLAGPPYFSGDRISGVKSDLSRGFSVESVGRRFRLRRCKVATAVEFQTFSGEPPYFPATDASIFSGDGNPPYFPATEILHAFRQRLLLLFTD
ncbi:hypothetical protein OROGR_008517 [Orobanche gracilis]